MSAADVWRGARRSVQMFLLVWISAGTEAAEVRDPVELLQEFLRVDTTNPPGNETRAVEFLGDILSAHGIPWEAYESAPGRGSLVARLEGGDEPALVLLNHTDVVPADARRWDEPPLSGNIRDGYVYGRGALDMKGLGILQLHTFLQLHASGLRLNRDVLFVATADEETGGYLGAGYLLKRHPEIFEGVGYLLNEGGRGQIAAGGEIVFSVEATQKVPLWLRITSTGHPSHGAAPRVDSSVTRLIRALGRLADHEFEARLVPAVRPWLQGMAELQSKHLRAGFEDPDAYVANREWLMSLQLDSPFVHSALRNTCSITRLAGSSKINVVPSQATAEIDCRLLPDQDPDAFVNELHEIFNDDSIEVVRLLSFSPASSPLDTPLFQVIADVMQEEVPGSLVLPAVSVGFTDSHFFRDADIVSYGFGPMLFAPGEYPPGEGAHGHNERVSVENIRSGARLLHSVVESFVTDDSYRER